jgi:hypothetical protein
VKWNLERKRALIWGATSHSGQYLARELARTKMHLCLADANSVARERLARECRFAHTLMIEFPVSPSDEAVAAQHPRTLSQFLQAEFDGIDMLVIADHSSREEPVEACLEECLPLLLANTQSQLLLIAPADLPQKSTELQSSVNEQAPPLYLPEQARRLHDQYARFGLCVCCIPEFPSPPADNSLPAQKSSPAAEQAARSTVSWLQQFRPGIVKQFSRSGIFRDRLKDSPGQSFVFPPFELHPLAHERLSRPPEPLNLSSGDHQLTSSPLSSSSTACD